MIEEKGMEEKTVCQRNLCTGCMACVDLCTKTAITIKDSISAYNAVIDTDKCVECGQCYKICQNNQEIQLVHPQKWSQGWITDEKLRAASSSGGAATAIARAFIERGGAVCSCIFKNGEFRFEIAETLRDIQYFAGSKYVKSNPAGIYKNILQKIKQGTELLFIGLPCQVSALKLYVGKKYQDKLYTVDLICHGTPSPQLLENFLAQYHIDIKKVQNISFRHKDVYGLSNDNKTIVQPGAVDPYLLAFLCSLDHTHNCYCCKYAGIDRVSDITLGDSWGSDLPVVEQSKGISLILCQTDKGMDLLNQAKMSLFPVDLEKAVSKNHQLREPVKETRNSNIFFEKYKDGSFNKAVFYGLPFKYVKQKIKAVLLKCTCIKGSKR